MFHGLFHLKKVESVQTATMTCWRKSNRELCLYYIRIYLYMCMPVCIYYVCCMLHVVWLHVVCVFIYFNILCKLQILQNSQKSHFCDLATQVTLFKDAKPLWANISACSWHSKRWSNSPSLNVMCSWSHGFPGDGRQQIVQLVPFWMPNKKKTHGILRRSYLVTKHHCTCTSQPYLMCIFKEKCKNKFLWDDMFSYLYNSSKF